MSRYNQNNFTRGSQIFAHQMRMLGQGSINSVIAGLIFSIIWLIFRVLKQLS
ncbi:putative conjugative transfer protein TraD [Rickettsia amblyommatis str. Darkwater]|uniref:Putative conjugative transfer protein TraD n=1 Tax=Rickettsia amblyommatis str. Ac/Pa TaxID=1359164 RepID=A0A0F3N3E0_RICAM|nr:putative conjugative transfer protein TraD [Rickettsia amblyommatis str. Ac/Pa]KJV90999.1 putative conjugative transfer protein TraD [Rickettsia amblyommatis str. Darkwater]